MSAFMALPVELGAFRHIRDATATASDPLGFKAEFLVS
jgi:hypothetical protein